VKAKKEICKGPGPQTGKRGDLEGNNALRGEKLSVFDRREGGHMGGGRENKKKEYRASFMQRGNPLCGSRQLKRNGRFTGKHTTRQKNLGIPP